MFRASILAGMTAAVSLAAAAFGSVDAGRDLVRAETPAVVERAPAPIPAASPSAVWSAAPGVETRIPDAFHAEVGGGRRFVTRS